MYSDIPFWLSLVLMLGGLAVLAWSSDVFVDGAAAVAKALGISPFIIGREAAQADICAGRVLEVKQIVLLPFSAITNFLKIFCNLFCPRS